MYLVFLNIEVFLSVAILNLIIWPLFLNSRSSYTGVSLINIFKICKHYLLFVLFISFFLLIKKEDISYNFFGYGFFVNEFVNLLKIIIVGCLFFLVLSIDILRIEKMKWIFPYGIFEIFPLILFNIFGILCFLSSENLLSAYISLELQSLTLSLLFAVKYFSKYSSESALKYFIVSSFSTSLLLLSFGFLYGIFGVIQFESFLYLISFDDINYLNSDFILFDLKLSNMTIFTLTLIFITFSIKLGAAPFHLWTLDVYEGTSMFITLYVLILPKIAYVGFLIKFVLYFYNFNFLFNNLFFFAGLLSVLIGTLGAILQTKIKRLFAYSAISNFGYVMFALSLGHLDGFLSSILFLVIYIITTCSIFFVLLSLISIKDNTKIKTIFQLQSLFLSGKSLMAFFFSLYLFGIASIPPFNIFIAKYYLLFSLLENLTFISFFSIFFIVLLSVISCFYYIRMIRLIFFKNLTSFYLFIPFRKTTFNLSFLISLFTFLNIFFFFYPEFFFDLLEYFILYNEKMKYKYISKF
jgi:proton-translocating NADH-quinone oxidoreductase chain N